MIPIRIDQSRSAELRLPMDRMRQGLVDVVVPCGLVLMRLFVRTIGIAQAKVKIGRANTAYNMRRMVWLAGTAPT